MATQPFIAVSLKDTGHVLGVLSREADATGGTDIAGLAPNGMPVRAPVQYPTLTVVDPPFEVVVPKEILQAGTVRQDDLGKRRQIFGNPMQSVVGGTTITPVPVAGASAFPTFAFGAVGADGRISQFTVTINPAAGSAGAVCYVILAEQTTATTQEKRAIRTVIPAGTTAANNVDITAVVPAPGGTASIVSIPKGNPYFVVVAVAGFPLQTFTVPT